MGYMFKELLSVKFRGSVSVSSLVKHSQQISSSVLQVERHQADFAGQEINEGSWWALLFCLIRTKFLCMEK